MREGNILIIAFQGADAKIDSVISDRFNNLAPIRFANLDKYLRILVLKGLSKPVS